MSEEHRHFMWGVMMAIDSDEIEMIVQRERIEEGGTFSAEAMERLHDELIVFVGTRLMRRWNVTQEPPSLLRVEMKVTAA